MHLFDTTKEKFHKGSWVRGVALVLVIIGVPGIVFAMFATQRTENRKAVSTSLSQGVGVAKAQFPKSTETHESGGSNPCLNTCPWERTKLSGDSKSAAKLCDGIWNELAKTWTAKNKTKTEQTFSKEKDMLKVSCSTPAKGKALVEIYAERR